MALDVTFGRGGGSGEPLDSFQEYCDIIGAVFGNSEELLQKAALIARHTQEYYFSEYHVEAQSHYALSEFFLRR